MKLPSLICFWWLIVCGSIAAQNLGNAFHVPDSAEVGGAHMRNPEFEIGAADDVTIYSGNQYQGGGNSGNQTGGYLYYKGASASAWSKASLGFSLQTGNNKYWSAKFNTSVFGVDDAIQYYLEVDYSDHNPTFVYGGDDITLTTGSASTAAAAPFTLRNRAAYIFHANNRVVTGTTATFTTKVGYIGKDAAVSSEYVNNGALYYTTDGSTPSGALGVAAGSTNVIPLSLDHLENDSSPAGNAMDWIGTLTNLPTYTTINYKISFWNSANNEEKFADYDAGASGTVFSFSIGTAGAPQLTVNTISADYTTTHVFVNEINNDQIPITVFFDPGVSAVDASTVQVYTNLNRRDYAALAYNGSFGIFTQEGIEPPSGDMVGTDDNHYYKAYAMTAAAGGGYTATLFANKTGAYRLTARYKMTASGQSAGNTNPWVYYTTNGRRDHALVVSPAQARDIQLYELNALNIDAGSDDPGQRSTFADLHDSSKRWNLSYLAGLGCNWVWFQPIHPDGIDGRQTDPNTGAPYSVGSPYAVKNFFEVMPLMGKGVTGSSTPANNDPNPVPPTDPSYSTSPRGIAKAEFSGFVAAADAAGVGVMLDAPFNHTAFDAEMGDNGVSLLSPASNASYTTEIRNTEARFFSLSGNYAARASSANNIAVAPDRGDFGKFTDVHDIYFGTYSALVDVNDADDGNYLNEGDQFFGYFGDSVYPNGDPYWNSVDFTYNGANNNITRNVWQYFAQYVPYWLGQTGHGDANGVPYRNSTWTDPVARLAADSKGIDGLRADFGQGLPPQCWEYIINVARSYKWNFVFMTESLDGGAVTYRSNRHFDVLNENIVFPFQNATTAQNYRDIFDQRRTSYGQSLVLMNSTSHDEEQYADPYQALIRYMVSGTIDGVPMVFYGQENGISTSYDSGGNPYVFGFDHTELNFGKAIVNFKRFNSLQPVLQNQTYALEQLYPDFAAVGQARAFSTALRSSNRYYLNQTDSSIQESIFSVAKYQTASKSPNVADVVFAFVNLDRNNDQQGNYNVNVNAADGTNLFGIKRGRQYNVRNISAFTNLDASRRNVYLIPGNISGDNLLDGGLFVALKKVPTSDSAWSTAPFEAQYLKVYDVTLPPTDSAPASAKAYALGPNATFNWTAVVDSDGGVSNYHLVVSTDAAGQNVVYDSLVGNVTTYTLTAAVPGQTLYARVAAVNNAGVQGAYSAISSGTPVLDPNADSDGDGVTNASEDLAGTNPLDASSSLRVTSLTRNAGAGSLQITWTSVPGKNYEVDSTTNLMTQSYSAVSGIINAAGVTQSYAIVSPAAGTFYRVRVVP